VGGDDKGVIDLRSGLSAALRVSRLVEMTRGRGGGEYHHLSYGQTLPPNRLCGDDRLGGDERIGRGRIQSRWLGEARVSRSVTMV